jgi:hypothetical protein
MINRYGKHQRPRCPVLGKIKYELEHDATCAADDIAFNEWGRGIDKAVSVFWCADCLSFHTGTKTDPAPRPAVDWREPLHIYREKEPPDRPKRHGRQGSF